MTGLFLICTAHDPGWALGALADPPPQRSRWRVSIPGHGHGIYAVLPATRTWTLHRSLRQRPQAVLIISCNAGAKPAVHVSFRDRIWNGDVAVHYKLGRKGSRSVRARPTHRGPAKAEFLGGRELIRDMMKSNVIEVAVEDIGFGVNEAVFHLAGAGGAIRRIERACRSKSRELAETGPVSRPRRNPEPAPPPVSPAGAHGDRAGPEAASSDPSHPQQTPSIPPERDPDVDEAPPPVHQTPPSIATDREAEQTETQAEGPEDRSSAADAPADASVAVHPPAQQESRGVSLTTFLHKYGRNRWGEVIYDWYKQCLDQAGIDRARVWYLSNEELAYLSKGETDQVRLSMLVSTDRNLDVPPRRLTCQGTARARELTIHSVELTRGRP